MLVPVSSHTTSTPAAEYTRSTVEPVHEAPGYSALHMLTVNVWPALAITPQVGYLTVSVLVWPAVYNRQDIEEVGIRVAADVGATVGAVGRADGEAESWPAAIVGMAVGNAEGSAEGRAVVGRRVGIALGENALTVGAAVGAYVTSCTPAGPATMAVPEQVVVPTQPSLTI